MSAYKQHEWLGDVRTPRPNLQKPEKAESGAESRAKGRNRREIGPGGVTPVIGADRMAGSAQIRCRDNAIVAGNLLSQRDHQRKGLLGDQDVSLPGQRKNGDAPLAARVGIDIRKVAAEFLHNREGL